MLRCSLWCEDFTTILYQKRFEDKKFEIHFKVNLPNQGYFDQRFWGFSVISTWKVPVNFGNQLTNRNNVMIQQI